METPKLAGAVFLSYASEDAPAAQKICAALRAAGIEVWFDQSELRGGDAWDQSIRRQIKVCALFIPIISRATHARAEGYFRLEWKLAIDRSHLIMAGKAFLLPVVIDDTAQSDEHVPDRFREVQWTRLADGETPPEFVARVRRLLMPEESAAAPATRAAAVSGGAGPADPTASYPVAGARAARQPLALWVIAALLAAGCAYLLATRLWNPPHSEPAARDPGASTGAPASPPTGVNSAPGQAGAFDPPAHSIAVLPFVNLSGDAKQEYFSDGLTEELLNSLAEIQALQVAARTSAFSFKGQETDVGTIARKLNVATVLEGSVRRSEHTVRITAQLINAKTGYHLWSKTYDRDLGDVLKLQSEIATAVAGALQVTLLGNEAPKIELGGTRNPAALDAYLHARQDEVEAGDSQGIKAAIDAYSQVIRLDPEFALAYAGRSGALESFAIEYATGGEIEEYHKRAQADVDKAFALAPDLAEVHLALAGIAQDKLELRRASQEFERAQALAPGNARMIRAAARFAIYMGRFDAGIASLRHVQILDPLNRYTLYVLGQGYFFAGRYDEAIPPLKTYVTQDHKDGDGVGALGQAYLGKGDIDEAIKVCKTLPDHWAPQLCLAIGYDKLGRRQDSDTMLAKMQATYADAASYQYSEIHAQRGDIPGALQWLERAVRVRDPGLVNLKADRFMDPLRKEPRFQAILKQLDFPD